MNKAACFDMRIGEKFLALLDPTLPVVSFYETRKITDMIPGLAGEMEIEDLLLQYFYIT